MRTEGIVVQWHAPTESGLIRSGAHAQPHLFRRRDLRSDCPLPVVGMAVEFESVALDGQLPRALAVAPATASTLAALIAQAPAPMPAPDAIDHPQAGRRSGWRALAPQLGALLLLAGAGWWLWSHPLA